MIKCKECNKDFKFLTERHLLKCSNLTTKQYLQKHPDAKLFSEEWRLNSVVGEKNNFYKDGRSFKRRNKEYKCKKCGSPITGRGKTEMCALCATKYLRNSTSKLEKEIFEEIKKLFLDSCDHKPIKNNVRGFLPDIIFSPNIIIEVYGDYWHANPEIYGPNDSMKRGILAKDLWQKDFIRQKMLEDMGYVVKIIWEKDWKERKDQILFDIRTSYDWDSCSF